jgi:putative colanic acid biosynthesis acetyltransferase WcaF
VDARPRSSSKLYSYRLIEMLQSAVAERRLSFINKACRAIWNVVWLCCYRPTPTVLHGWRRFLLRLFGAKIHMGAHAYPSAKIWAPWNLEMGDGACLSHDVDCYSVDKVIIGKNATVSQYSFLCTATKNYDSVDMTLCTAPIVIGDDAWVAADVFISPGVTIGEGAVVLARATVTSNIPAWCIAKGNPAVPVRTRRRQNLDISK